MKLLNRIGGSIALLYLVCVLFAVFAVGFGPAVLVPSAHADSTELAKVIDVTKAVAADKAEAKIEAVEEQSVVDKAADKIPNWLELLGTLIGVASAIAAVTPTPKDNVVLGVVRKVLDIFALNVGGAKNASAEQAKHKSNRLL